MYIFVRVSDPQFTGFGSEQYQVHGVDGQIYALFSSYHCQINAKFTFMQSVHTHKSKSFVSNQHHHHAHGENKNASHSHHPHHIPHHDTSTTRFTHPGQYLSEVGNTHRSICYITIEFQHIQLTFAVFYLSCVGVVCNDNSSLVIIAGKYETGFSKVYTSHDTSKKSWLSYHYKNNDKTRVYIHIPHLSFSLENSDSFVNLGDMQLNLNYGRDENVEHKYHGLLG